ncbi:MAG: cytochrome d ubiquinol oxidase subunit II [Gammaproteobacteria bacterium]|nr:cytochrome d ubiquinol oxidase subunit II [Gammaproteobacteria bacterium]
MFDYTVLKMIWWAIIGGIFVIYSCTAGFDFGMTLIMPFLRKEENRKLALAASMPTWDGNMTWLVFAGGALFVVWPVVYATAFSGLYFAFFAVLWSMFLRPPGFDYRERIDSHRWRRCWDVALFISAFIPVVVFGVGMANCLLGFPFHFDSFSMRGFYTGNFGGLLSSGYAWLGAFISLFMIIMHGAAYLQRRVEGELRELSHKLITIFTLLVFVLFTIGLILVVTDLPGYILKFSPAHPTSDPLGNIVTYSPHAWAQSYHEYPWKYYPLMSFYAGIVLTLWANFIRARAACFWFSCSVVASTILAVGVTLFPFIMPSSTNPNQSLTVFNSTSSYYSLGIMLYVGVILLAVILAYKIFAYYSTWHKKPSLTVADIENEGGY